MSKPSEPVVRAWTRLIRAGESVRAAIERELKAAGVAPLAWYDVLLELVRSPQGRLRPLEIEQKTLLAQYNLSRLLDRLERQGLVAREPHGDDARGQWIAITAKGRTLQARTWKVYARAIETHVGEKLDDRA